MEYVRLGKTEITVPKNGFGALPIQRVSMDEAVKLLRKAYDNNITFFDTARWYTDSEAKIGRAFKDLRSKVYIASKTGAQDAAAFWRDLETSLTQLGTDYLDLYQFHNPAFCPMPDGEDGLYNAMLQAKAQGKIRHIGITNHRLSVAHEAIAGGWYETLQFPFSYLATQVDVDVVRACEQADMGFLAMKALSGGLITNVRAAYAYLAQFPSVLPIWGIQRERELDEFLGMNDAPARMDDELAAVIEADRQSLAGSFCRGCGYCMPCPVGIEINNCARISLLLRRSPAEQWFNEEMQAKMNRIEDCLHCGQCENRCPYGLTPQTLLTENLKDYREMLAAR